MLSGEPIFVKGIGHIRSPFLRELRPFSGIGYDIYSLYLNFLSWDKEEIIKYDKLIGLRGVDKVAQEDALLTFDVITIFEPTREFCREVLSFFMPENLKWEESKRAFMVFSNNSGTIELAGEINRNNFDELRKSILQMNFIGLDETEEREATKHSSEHAKELWEKAQKFLKDQNKPKDNTDKPEYHIGNIISKLCAAHPSYNYLNVFDLTVFQLYDAFFQFGYMRSSDLSERIFSNHGGDKFNFEDWLKPILKHV